MSEEGIIEFGRPNERTIFAQTHRKFIEAISNLSSAAKTAFIRDYPNKLTYADRIILALSKICWDNFGQIQLLCANRCGDGAFIILRSMFENLVNARYLHLYPEKAELFLEFFFIHMRTVRNQLGNSFGEDRLSEDYKTLVANNFQQVRDKFSWKTSKGKEKTRASWSDMGLVDMAIAVGLKEFIVPAYYLPIERAHPSVPSVMAQATALGNGKYILFKEDLTNERSVSSDALMIAHKLQIEVFILQYEHFHVADLDNLIGLCLKDFQKAWRGYKKAQRVN